MKGTLHCIYHTNIIESKSKSIYLSFHLFHWMTFNQRVLSKAPVPLVSCRTGALELGLDQGGDSSARAASALMTPRNRNGLFTVRTPNHPYQNPFRKAKWRARASLIYLISFTLNYMGFRKGIKFFTLVRSLSHLIKTENNTAIILSLYFLLCEGKSMQALSVQLIRTEQTCTVNDNGLRNIRKSIK